MKLKSLSIFFPCYNDDRTIESLVRRGYKAAKRSSWDFELIVVDDGSNPNTKTKLKILKKNYPSLIIITHKVNKGYGAALKSGFDISSKQWVFYTDGDGQYDPSELVKLIAKLKEDVDVVNGYKLSRKDNMLRIISGLIYNKILHTIYNLPISDIDCDFRLIRRELLKKINLKSSSGTICLELVVKLKRQGARFLEVGVNHYPRLYGNSQFFRLPSLIKTLAESLKFVIDRN
ncbi:glycosyltransferase family 2 protein [Candidatus Gottesmanbacteria bacterium]|nr:glycosyltransferase family 2 protein [Candidatus Gottesmanbacteria bacterium]